jgi:hypothetical protein
MTRGKFVLFGMMTALKPPRFEGGDDGKKYRGVTYD